MPYQPAKISTLEPRATPMVTGLATMDTGKLRICSSEDLRRICTSLAEEKYHAPVRIDLVQRSSFTEAQVVSDRPSYTRQAGAEGAPQLKALSTSVRAALESLWRKLKRVE